MRDGYYSEPPSYFARPVAPWEHELAASLEAIFTSGTHDLGGIVAGLNKTSVRPPGGDDWTVESFRAVLKQVGW